MSAFTDDAIEQVCRSLERIAESGERAQGFCEAMLRANCQHSHLQAQRGDEFAQCTLCGLSVKREGADVDRKERSVLHIGQQIVDLSFGLETDMIDGLHAIADQLTAAGFKPTQKDDS